MHFDPVMLSRIEFAWIIAWHILMPRSPSELRPTLHSVEGMSLATGRKVDVRISHSGPRSSPSHLAWAS